MSLIEINNFSQNFGDKVIYNDANFVLNNGEKIGIIGLNGAGKSTLLKILSGEVLIDSGSVYKNPKYSIKYLDQYLVIEGEMSIKDYLAGAYKNLFDAEKKLEEINNALSTETNQSKVEKLLNQSGDLFDFLQENDFYSIDSNIEKVASGLGVSALGLDTSVANLSGGQRAKVRLAKLLLEEPDVLILDEPTNFLDVSHIDWLTKFIKNSNKSFIIVSHDENFLNNVVTHICDVENGKICKYLGNLDKVKELKETKKELQEKAYSSQQKQIKKIEDYIAKNKARAATAKMAHSREKWLEKMDVLDPPADSVKPSFKFANKEFAGNVMIKVNDLSVGYNGKPLLKKKVSFELCKNDRLAITGFNGIGKTTLLKTILGKIPAISGEVEVSKNVLKGYYEQEQEFSHFNGTPLMYILDKFPKLMDKEARMYLSKCGLTTNHCRKQISQLSGGEKSKIELCELTIEKSNLLILDEPTNHLDYLAIDRLKEAIKEFDGAVIFVSHDKQFVEEVATKQYNLEKNV